MGKEKALIAMSGGVDSSVAGFLAKQEFDCMGATMLLCDGLTDTPANTDDACSVAERLGIPFYVFDHTALFREKVVDTFIRRYEEGGTPNPCLYCNRHLKFDALMQDAKALGNRFVVTGHYAKIEQDPQTGRYLLKKAADTSKASSRPFPPWWNVKNTGTGNCLGAGFCDCQKAGQSGYLLYSRR